MDYTAAISKLISILSDEVGYLEKASNYDLYSKNGNAGKNNYTKYWAEIAPEYQGQPWCACLMTWGLVKAFGLEVAKKMLKHYPYVYCPTMGSLFTKYANPKVGDIVIFWRNGTFAHTGLVVYVGPDGNYFETIEGNTSDGHTIVPNGGAVCRKSYYNSNLPGTKFIRLDYSLAGIVDDITESEDAIIEAKIREEENTIEMLKEEIKALTDEFIYNYVDDNMPEFARPIVAALCEVGVLAGVNDDGDLALKYKDLRTIAMNYRGGAYDAKLQVTRDGEGNIISSPIVEKY